MSDPLTVAGGFVAGTVGVTLATLFPEATPGVMLSLSEVLRSMC